MTLIAMAVHDTEENNRTEYTRRTINNLIETVDWEQHRLIIVDNGSCYKTKSLLQWAATQDLMLGKISIITNTENIGTAKAINQAWALREPEEYLVKMDNDVEIHNYGWLEDMQEAIERKPTLGIVGLKRKDLMENPYRNDAWKSTLEMLPPYKEARWMVIENVEHCMGTCTMFNPNLIYKIGGLMQPGMYGFDDTLASVRAKLAGFTNAFLPHIEIDHIDTGGDAYTQWKRDYAGERANEFYRMKEGLINGTIPIKVEL